MLKCVCKVVNSGDLGSISLVFNATIDIEQDIYLKAHYRYVSLWYFQENATAIFIQLLDWNLSFPNYRKILKIGTPEINYHNCPTIGIVGFYRAVLCSKDADRITNREDPDQTAP